jgi:VWFA-related protein
MAPKADSVPAATQTSKPTAQTQAEATPPPPPDTGDEPLITITRQVDVVNVIFTVTDKHGNFVKDLAQKDIAIRDNSQAPKQVLAFSRETNLPLRVGLLIDASNSIRDRFKFEQESASEFLAQVIRHRSDQAFVIGFDTVAEVTADFTDNSEKLDKGIRSLRPGGGTALYDAIYFACRDKLLKAPQTGAVRRAIVLISDGDDNQSRVTREEAIEMAQRAEVIVYTISTNTNGYREQGDKTLERIAEQTGGRAFFPFKAEDVANAFSAIQDELRSQYAIAYKPAELAKDGHYHAIEILTENHKGLKVRAKKGYYAPK